MLGEYFFVPIDGAVYGAIAVKLLTPPTAALIQSSHSTAKVLTYPQSATVQAIPKALPVILSCLACNSWIDLKAFRENLLRTGLTLHELHTNLECASPGCPVP